MERVITYIDGFNLYFGLKSRGWQRYYWLDIVALSRSVLKPNQCLVAAKYFTSRISSPPDKQRRQNDFLEALGTLSGLQIYYGHFLSNERICRNCGYSEMVPSEKMTDVNIAVELLTDAFQDNMDTAVLVSADSDLVGPVATLRKLYPGKRIAVTFPPNRKSRELMKCAHAYFNIGEDKLRHSQFPDQVHKSTGHILQRPVSWK